MSTAELEGVTPPGVQVLLSQVHRMRALKLLGRFLDMGSWAVDLALSVGIFPYVLKLLQTTASDLRPTLVFIWTKILALDKSCQVPPPPPPLFSALLCPALLLYPTGLCSPTALPCIPSLRIILYLSTPHSGQHSRQHKCDRAADGHLSGHWPLRRAPACRWTW